MSDNEIYTAEETVSSVLNLIRDAAVQKALRKFLKQHVDMKAPRAFALIIELLASAIDCEEERCGNVDSLVIALVRLAKLGVEKRRDHLANVVKMHKTQVGWGVFPIPSLNR